MSYTVAAAGKPSIFKLQLDDGPSINLLNVGLTPLPEPPEPDVLPPVVPLDILTSNKWLISRQH